MSTKLESTSEGGFTPILSVYELESEKALQEPLEPAPEPRKSGPSPQDYKPVLTFTYKGHGPYTIARKG